MSLMNILYEVLKGIQIKMLTNSHPISTFSQEKEFEFMEKKIKPMYFIY